MSTPIEVAVLGAAGGIGNAITTNSPSVATP
jgi:hypothetical protein